MSRIPPNQLAEILGQVREAWARSADGPALASLLTQDVRSDDAALAEILLADADERASRGRPAGFGVYLDALPEIVHHPETARALLMHELSRLPPVEVRAVSEEMIRLWPDAAGHIRVVADLCDAMGASLEPSAFAGGRATLTPGQRLGKYELLARLGDGSFGEVWQARDAELDRFIALKVLYGGGPGGDEATLERVLAEARAAAALNHENIVTVHATGRFAEIARYYIDSALVGDPDPTPQDPKRVNPGRSLEEWLRRGATPREIARVMAAVCRGIASAHARGVLHRDIKPANVLVTASGRPFVADFGLSTTGLPPRVARDAPHLQSVSLRTESGRRIVGTPAYMSPEQAAGERPTTLSDVYSLGATLRFMLTGSPPFMPSGRFSGDARWDVIAQVREAKHPGRIDAPGVPRTLAAIADRAMSPRPEGRYQSAAEMGDDLEAWRAHRPTRARPVASPGTAALWFRRNPALGTLAVATTLAAAAGAAAYVIRVGRERDRALAAEALAERHLTASEAARAAAEATSQFLDGILASPDPGIEGKDVTVLSALNRSSALIEQRLQGQETVEAAVRTSIGHAYRALEDIKQARPHLDRALDIRMRLLGAEHRDTLKTRHELALVTSLESKVEDAIVMMRDVVDASRRTLGDDHGDTVDAIHDLAATLAWSPRPETLDEALELYRDATERRTRLFGPEDRRTLSSKQGWAGIYYSKGKFTECEPLIRELVDAYRRIAEPTDVVRLGAIRDLAVVLRAQGKNEEALPLLTEAYEGLKTQMPPGHIELLTAGITLAGVLNGLEKGEEALAVARDISAAADAHLGEENTFRWMTHVSLGDSYTTLGRFEDAERELLHAHASIAKVIGKEARTTRAAARGVVRLYEKWGRPDKVEEWKPLTVRPPAPTPAPGPPAAPK
jgi:serine/threonine protein kinase